MQQFFFRYHKQQIQQIADDSHDDDGGVHGFDLISHLRVDDQLAQSRIRTYKHLRDNDHDQCYADCAAQADESLRQAFPKQYPAENLAARRPHDLAASSRDFWACITP